MAHQCERRSLTYEPFTTVFHHAGAEHADEIGPAGGRFFSIEFESRWLEMLGHEYRTTRSAPDLAGGDLTWLATRLYREYALGSGPLALECLAAEALAIACRAPIAIDQRAPAWLARVVDRLHADFSAHLTLADLASDAQVHPVHLSTMFRRRYGLSIGQYTHRLRVRHACGLMRDPEAGMAEIAVAAGFTDQSHFTRVFKKLAGSTPAAFRKLTYGTRQASGNMRASPAPWSQNIFVLP